jgi:hypothetical protein
MDWVQFLILFLTMIGVFLTLRSDSRRFEEKMDKYDKELKEFRERWAEESKDFHGRLIAIEERRNKIIFKE